MSSPTLESTRSPRISLLEADPELGSLVDDALIARAHVELIVKCTPIRTGPWSVQGLLEISAAHVGLLVLSGVIAREVTLAGEVSTELLGAGDLLRPWGSSEESHLLDADVRWNVIAGGHVAMLDAPFMARASAYPGIAAALIERADARAARLATAKAIAQLTRVDERLVALVRHLSERWGRVTPDGVHVPLRLSHRTLGELVGARRPSVSTAAALLERNGRLTRRPDGTWLVRDTERHGRAAPESVAQRRRLVPA